MNNPLKYNILVLYPLMIGSPCLLLALVLIGSVGLIIIEKFNVKKKFNTI